MKSTAKPPLIPDIYAKNGGVVKSMGSGDPGGYSNSNCLRVGDPHSQSEIARKSYKNQVGQAIWRARLGAMLPKKCVGSNGPDGYGRIVAGAESARHNIGQGKVWTGLPISVGDIGLQSQKRTLRIFKAPCLEVRGPFFSLSEQAGVIPEAAGLCPSVAASRFADKRCAYSVGSATRFEGREIGHG